MSGVSGWNIDKEKIAESFLGNEDALTGFPYSDGNSNSCNLFGQQSIHAARRASSGLGISRWFLRSTGWVGCFKMEYCLEWTFLIDSRAVWMDPCSVEQLEQSKIMYKTQCSDLDASSRAFDPKNWS